MRNVGDEHTEATPTDEAQFQVEGEGVNNAEDYKVGYKKPPLDTQFKNKSGNPGGLKPKPKYNSPIDQMLSKTFKVNLNGRVQKLTAYEAVTLNIINLAMKGDPPHVKLFYQLCDKSIVFQALLDSRNEENKKFCLPALTIKKYDDEVVAELVGITIVTNDQPKLRTWALIAALERREDKTLQLKDVQFIRENCEAPDLLDDLLLKLNYKTVADDPNGKPWPTRRAG